MTLCRSCPSVGGTCPYPDCITVLSSAQGPDQLSFHLEGEIKQTGPDSFGLETIKSYEHLCGTTSGKVSSERG
jgi:hypothetical protein